MSRNILATLGLIAGIALAVASPAFAGVEVNTAPGGVLVGGKPAPGLAVHGFDVVAFFTESKPVQGDAAFAIVNNGATYRFASQANLDLFKANPAKYEPAYGGYCAFGVSVNAKFDGDPRYWTIADGKLYLNLDKGISDTFKKDLAGSIKKAEANWPKIKDKAPGDIK
jgi:YHS domain-containing protein